MPNKVVLKDGTTFMARRPDEFLEWKELPSWVRICVAMQYVGGHSWAEVSKRTGRSAGTLSNWRKNSPAVKEWIKELKEATLDANFMARAVFESSSYQVSLEYFAIYEKAIAAGDYKEAARMSQDMLDRAGVVKKKDKVDQGKITVTLNLGSASLEPAAIEADFTVIEEDEDE